MSQTPLIRSDASDEERALLLSARGDHPSAGARQRLLASLGVAASVTAAASSASAVSASATLNAASGAAVGVTAVMKALGAGLVAGLLVAGAANTLSRNTDEAPVPSLARATTAAPPSEGVAPKNELHPAANADTTSSAGPKLRKGAEAAPRVTTTDVAGEVLALDRARTALAAGDSARALAELDAHQRRFAVGVLQPEADVLRIEALASRGAVSTAQKLGQEFLARHPTSPHAARVRARLAALSSSHPNVGSFPGAQLP